LTLKNINGTIHEKSAEDVYIQVENHDEPEVPLTGYNYARYKYEGALFLKTAKSA